MTKREQRKQLRAALGAMSPQEKQDASQAICEQLSSIASIRMAETIVAYLPLPSEVDIRPLLDRWLLEPRTVGVPIVSWKEATMQIGRLTNLDEESLLSTRHGLQEPKHRQLVPSDSIDVMLVPGMGFDATGGRLGRGGGYYDRYLGIARPPIVLGIAFLEQMLPSVPHEKHDQHMTAIVTPSGIMT